jgi:endonuclease III
MVMVILSAQDSGKHINQVAEKLFEAFQIWNRFHGNS